MKVSQITISDVCNHIREVEEELEKEDVVKLEAIQKAAVQYCVGYTGISEENLDNYEDITIAVLALISDLWDNRAMTVSGNNMNRVVDTILGMHCTNLLPTAEG